MDVLSRLRQEMPSLPKKLALAARYAIDFPDRIALNSMRTSATEVGVTSTTMLRLARQLGFENYEEFKAGFQTQLVATGFGTRAGALHSKDGRADGASLSEKILAASQQNLRSTLSDANLRNLSSIASLIRNAPTCYLIGSGAAFWLANVMKTTGTMILPNLRIVGAEFAVAAEDMSKLNKDDVVICFGLNPCATRSVEALQYAKSNGAHTVAMTDRPSSPLIEFSDYAFYADTQSPHYYPSISAMMILIETLLANVVAEGGAKELERINDFEAHRKASNSYIEY